MPRFLILTLLSAVLAHPSLVHSQSSSLTGVVVDPSGAVVPDTTISVLSESGEAIRQVVSGSDGKFLMSGLPFGKYTVTAKYPGMHGFRKDGIRLKPGKTRMLEITVGLSRTPDRLNKISRPFAMIVERIANSDFERELIDKAEHAACPESQWMKRDDDEPFWPRCLNHEAVSYYEDLIRKYGEGIYPKSISKLDSGHAYYSASVKKEPSKKGWVVEMNFEYSHSCGNLCGLGFGVIRSIHFDEQMRIVKIDGDNESVYGWIS